MMADIRRLYFVLGGGYIWTLRWAQVTAEIINWTDKIIDDHLTIWAGKSQQKLDIFAYFTQIKKKYSGSDM